MNTWKTTFKPGDRAYLVKNIYCGTMYGVAEVTIDYIQITKNGIEYYWVEYVSNADEPDELWDDGCFYESDIGRDVFKTYKEAEKEALFCNKNI